MLAIVVIVFVITTGISTLVDCIVEVGNVNPRHFWAMAVVAYTLLMFNNAFNDFIYFLMSTQFRETLRRLVTAFTRHCTCRGTQNDEHAVNNRGREGEENLAERIKSEDLT